MNSRPSSDQILQIAERLELRKNVVRVWFCNQRQKQKRMRNSTTAENSEDEVVDSENRKND